ncbi:MAG: class I SAM-dependent methyltransferase [Acidobacteriota bacterium]
MRLSWIKPKRSSARGKASAETLSPGEGYRRWAQSYGVQPNAFQQLEAPLLAKLLPDVKGRRVLDLGCGKGRVSQLAQQRGAARVVASDLSLSMLIDERGYPGPKLVCDAGQSLPFGRHSFDLVVCALVLGHIEHLGGALSAIGESLRPGGHLIISDFHPFATLRGWQRTFEDPVSGQTRAIEQHLHLFSEYIGELGRRDLTLEAMEEATWEDFPVLFVMRTHKRAIG